MRRGLNREGAYLKFWLRGEGLIREGGLIERGLNRAFMVSKVRGHLTRMFF